MVGKRTADVVAFRSVSYLCLGLYALMCLLPFAIIVAASVTDEMTILVNGYSLAPARLSLSAYRMIFQVPQKMLRAYGITIFSTGVGTALGLFLMSMAAYVLNRKDFRYRNGVAFYLYFTTLFSGGLVPYYILMMKVFGLRNNILAIILPNLISVWSVLLMRNFMQSIPDSLYESAKIDGAGDFRIYLSIILPLSASSLATIGLFQALAYWNEWYNAMLFFQDRDMFPLQLFLKNMLSSTNVIELVKSGVNVPRDMVPTEAMKMAMAVVAIGPVVLFYPFIQKFLIAGITVGAVKG